MKLPDIYGELTCIHLNHWVYPYSSFKEVAMYDIILRRVSQIQDTPKSLMLFDFWASVIIMVAHDNSQCKSWCMLLLSWDVFVSLLSFLMIRSLKSYIDYHQTLHDASSCIQLYNSMQPDSNTSGYTINC